MENIIQGIMISEASTIVENAFRGVLDLDDDDLAKLSPDDKFGKFANAARVGAILEFVREDSSGGLPSMNPPRTILNEALSGISTDSAIRLLIKRLSDFAFYFN